MDVVIRAFIGAGRAWSQRVGRYVSDAPNYAWKKIGKSPTYFGKLKLITRIRYALKIIQLNFKLKTTTV